MGERVDTDPRPSALAAHRARQLDVDRVRDHVREVIELERAFV
jgi:hypothetical protein